MRNLQLMMGLCLVLGMVALSFFLKGLGFLLALLCLTLFLLFYFFYKMAQALWLPSSFKSAEQTQQEFIEESKESDSKKQSGSENADFKNQVELDYLRIKQVLLDLKQDYEEGKLTKSEYDTQNKQLRAQAITLLSLLDQNQRLPQSSSEEGEFQVVDQRENQT